MDSFGEGCEHRMDEFVADTDPDLRALLAACQSADAPLPALAALADWLDGRGDPRGPVVRIQARYWYVYYTSEGYERYYSAEAGAAFAGKVKEK
jgi:uncharacterized protein (TIGR02996 family)